jgi:polyisoprenyl-phosphate glycosyltransferase
VDVSVVATCFNNGLSIGEFLERVLTTLQNSDRTFEIVVVDDGSTDQSWNEIYSFAKRDPRIRGIQLSRNFGQHPAILAGLDSARGEVIVLMDSDLADEPEELPRLIEPILRNEADIVITRTIDENRQRISSRLFHAMVQWATKSPNLVGIGTFRALNSRVVTSLREYRDHSVLYGPLSTQLGYRQTTIDLVPKSSARSKSNYNFWMRAVLAWPLLLHEVGLALKAMLLGFAVILVFSLTLGLVAMFRFVVDGGDPLSTTSLVYLVLVTNQVLLGVGIAVNTFYSRSILRESLRRPRYHISKETSWNARS